MLKVSCDICHAEFNATDKLNNGIDRLLNGVERHYIECPNCQEQYTSYYLNDQMKIMQQQIMALRKKPHLKVKQRNRLNKLVAKMHRMNEQIGQEVEGNDQGIVH